MTIRKWAVCIAAALAPQWVQAEPGCQVNPGRPMIFRLDLTVPATFCSGGRAAQDPSCDDFPKEAAIQLHGLWPNYRKGGFPSGSCGQSDCPTRPPSQGKYCGYPEPPNLYAQNWWQGLSGYMAGTEKCLERHEWVKHGTCSGMDAPTYFQWALMQTERIEQQLQLPLDTFITRKEFDGWVRQRLPEFAGAFRLTCSGEALSGVYLIFEWGNPPGKVVKNSGGRNHFGNCKQAFYLPTTPN